MAVDRQARCDVFRCSCCGRGENLYLRDTLLVHASEKGGPSYSARVLALEEEGLGLAILEAEDLAVTADKELALY